QGRPPHTSGVIVIRSIALICLYLAAAWRIAVDVVTRQELQAKSAVGFAILLQIVPRVIQPDLTLFQEPVEFVSRLKTEDALQLRRRQLAFAIRLECDGLDRCSREVRTRSRQGSREFIRKIEADLHGASIATRANAGRSSTRLHPDQQRTSRFCRWTP